MKKINFVIISLVCLPLILMAQGSLSVNLKYDVSEFEFQSERYLKILPADETYVLPETAGEPSLPMYHVNVLLPENCELTNVFFSTTEEIVRTNEEIFPTQETAPISKIGNYKFRKPGIAYQSDVYPEKAIFSESMQRLNGYHYVSMLVSPFKYYPQSKELALITSLDINIEYSTNQQPVTRYDNENYAELIKSIVINPEDIYKVDASNLREETIDYVIITSEDLVSSFDELVEWKRAKGLWTEVVTTEHIYNNYSGATAQLQIKNFLYDYYLNRGLVWVLLGGDNTVVPDQNAFVVVGEHSDSTIPADLFYGTFDNAFDWNADGDGIYGEVEDNVDLAPELIISRLPIRTAQHVIDYVTKSINYEKNPPSADYAQKMLLVGDQLWQTWEGRSDADWRNERLWNDYVLPYWDGTKYRFYDTNTDFGGAGYNVTAANLVTQMSSGYNFTFVASHGSPTSISMESGASFSPASAASITDVSGVFSTIACNTNRFDYSTDPCVSEAMLRNPNGGSVTYQGSSRYGWGINYPVNFHGPSYRHADQLFMNIFDSELSAINKFSFGMAASKAKLTYIASAESSGSYRWLQYSLNSMGDPDITLFTQDPVDIVATVPESIEPGTNMFNVTSNVANAIITIMGDNLYVKGETDDSGNFSTSLEITTQSDVTVTITSPNYRYFTSVVSAASAQMAPPTGSGPENTPVAIDAENDNGGYVNIDFILSENDPYHSEAVTPSLDHYAIERYVNEEWVHVANVDPEATVNGNYRALLIAVPTSILPYPYRMSAVCGSGQGTDSDWVEVGTASSADEMPVNIDFKVFLEGAYIGSETMRHTLIEDEFLPMNSPYDSVSVSSFPEIMGNNIVDWIYVQLKDQPDGDVLQSTSAFLLDDGSIVNTVGEANLSFYYTTGNEYYVIVKHRNHVEVISNIAYQLSDDSMIPTEIDFSIPDAVMGIGHKVLDDGNWALLTGDSDGNGQVQNNDKNDFWNIHVGLAGYYGADFNLNGQVQNNDKNDFWNFNVGRGSTVPTSGGRGDSGTETETGFSVVSGSNLEINFANSEIRDGYLEFDIVLKSTDKELMLGDTHIYLNYSSVSFNDFIIASGGLEIEKGSLFAEEVVPGISFYSEAKIEDNDRNILSLEMEYNFSSNPEYAVWVSDEYQVLYHARMEIADESSDILVRFDESAKISMKTQQYTAENENPIRFVKADDQIFIAGRTQRNETEIAASVNYGLFSNYPNPFNPETQISFRVKDDADCEVTIYNAKGQKVKKIFSEYVQANTMQMVSWNGVNADGHSVSSGIYFYKLRTGNNVQVKKMILQK